MKLVRFGAKGAEKPGLIDGSGMIRDLSGLVDDYQGEAIGLDALDCIRDVDPGDLPEVDPATRIGPVLARVGNFIAIGLNYADHAAEAGLPVPSEPILFNKAPSSLSGPNDEIAVPYDGSKLDWEAELAVVIGRRCYKISESDALSAVSGYCICNDISERAWQAEGTGQWVKGKSGPTFGPLGPWLVTPDEIPDPQNLDLALDVNGERMQTGSTATMIFPVATLIAFTSNHMVLEPGDVITTGTPPGVGMGRNPQVWLQPGDEMHLTIRGLGEQRQTVVTGY